MVRIQLILASIFILILITCKISLDKKSTCISYTNYNACYCFEHSDKELEKFNNFQFLKFKVDKNQQITSLISDLDKSLKTKTSQIAYEIDIDNARYEQFIMILDVCIRNDYKQIVHDDKSNILYIYPDCIAKPNTNSFSGCFYTIYSDKVDFDLPARM